jgi:hypothetical protein
MNIICKSIKELVSRDFEVLFLVLFDSLHIATLNGACSISSIIRVLAEGKFALGASAAIFVAPEWEQQRKLALLC